MKYETSGTPKVAFVASIYRHFAAFHKPYMKWFQLHGFEVHAYAQNGDEKKEITKLGVICHDVPFQRSPLQLDNIQALTELTKSFREEKFQVVHVHTPVAGVLGRIAAKRSGVPAVIYTAHGFHFLKGAPLVNWLTFYPIERIMARYTDYLITINKEDYERARRFPVRKDVQFIKGVGVDLQQYRGGRLSEELLQKKRETLGIEPGDFVILCIAELNNGKNQIQLIEAVKELKASGPVKCLLAGNGESEQKLKQLAAGMNLNENVQFLGFRKDVPELIEVADVVTLLSKREGLPRAIMEALAAGKPAVVTDVRGNRDLVRQGENGYVVELGNVNETAQAFQSLMNNRDLLIQMGEKSFEMSLEYDLSTIVQEMDKLYEKVIREMPLFAKQEVVG